jgi:hypothetical protein
MRVVVNDAGAAVVDMAIYKSCCRCYSDVGAADASSVAFVVMMMESRP